MRKKFYLVTFLAPVMALTLHSCIKDPEWGRTLESSQLEAADARTFFENYAADLPEGKLAGITPGNFAPEWGKALPTSCGGVDYLNVPIVAEHAYEGYFAKGYTQTPDDEKGYYHTAIAQRLVVAREEETDRFACALATIIPAEGCATKSSSEVLRLFYCGGANARFSGVVMYSTLEDGGYTLCVDRYQGGVITARRDLHSSNAKEMAALVGVAKVFKKVGVRTKSSEDSGGLYGVNELDEVVVTAPAPSIGGGSYWLPPMSPSGDSDESSGGSRSGSGGGGGGSSGSGGGYSGNSNNNASNAPQAQKIFHNSSLNSTQWATIESMINKILADCIGRKLYDGVDSKMGDNTIKIGYNTALGEQGQFKGNEIVIGSSESNILYHELFHLYQYYAGGFSNFTSRELNYEVEAWYAQYVFTIGQQGYTGSYWERMYTRSDVGASIQKLGDEIRNNGTTSSVALSERINDIKTELSNLKGADGTRPYKNANYSSSYATLQFFLNFASGCL